MKIKYHLFAEKSITVIDDCNNPYPVPIENPLFDKIKTLLRAGKFEKAGEAIDVSKTIEKHSSGLFYVRNGQVCVGGDVLPKSLSDRVLQFTDEHIDITPLMNFWNNVALNPSEDSKKDLYGFLEHNNIPITVDGCFIAYKRVRDDYMDFYTGNYDNHIGKLVQEDRNLCDPDRNVTCSKGLHVCAFGYLQHYHGGSGRIMEIKINPRDVVSVPTDYSNLKLRCCEYYVVAEVERPNEDILYTQDKSYEDDTEDFNEEDTVMDILDTIEIGDDKEVSNLITLKPDNRGRICIPSKIVKDAGFNAGDKVSVLINTKDGTIKVWDEAKFCYGAKLYTVDAHNNLRVGRCLMNSFLVADVDSNYIYLEA